MSPQATGRLQGNDLIIERRFRAPIDDVWASITRPEKTALWFGPWEGEAGQGMTVRLQLVHEKDRPWTDLRIDACEAPHRLAVATVDEFGEWRMELTLAQENDVTTLRFVQRLSDPALAAEVGPGWEYYLDMLVAAREGRALPSFGDYYPAQKAHYLQGL